MSSSKKNLPGKGLCGRTLSEFIDWRYSQSCWHFRPSFVNCCPSNLLSGSTFPPTPFPVSMFNMYLQCVAGRRWGDLSPVRDHILQETNTLYLIRLKPTILQDHPKQILRRGGGLREINTCRKVPLQVNFFRWRQVALVFLSLISPRSIVYDRAWADALYQGTTIERLTSVFEQSSTELVQ